MARRATLAVHGADITAQRFLVSATEFLSLHTGMDSAMGAEPGLEWHVTELRHGSTYFGVSPRDGEGVGRKHGAAVVLAVAEGFRDLEEGPRRPRFFNDRMLETARGLAKRGAGTQYRLVVSATGDDRQIEVRLSARTVAHVDEILSLPTVEVGSVEGRVETLSMHGSDKFNIYEPFAGRRIECRCEQGLLDQAHEAFGKRALVEGEVTVDAYGNAIRVKASSLTVLEADDALPEIADVHGMWADDDGSFEDILQALGQAWGG